MAQNVSRRIIDEFVITGFETCEKPLVVGVIILVVYMLVMFSNLCNICFIMIDKRLHQPMYLFICNLAVVDMLYCTSSCPTMIGVLLVGYNRIAYGPCIVQLYVFGLGFVMELFTITAMAFDRLIAIINPLHYHSIVTNFRSVMLTFLMWVAGLSGIYILPGTVLPLPLCSSTVMYMFCDYGSVVRATCVNPGPYFNIMAIVSFVLQFGTFTFICGSYLMIISVVIKMSSNGSKKKVFNTCFSHLVVVVCYYGPTFAIIVLTRTGVVLTLEQRNGLRIGTILAPSLINPFIYSFRTKEIKNKVLSMLTKAVTSKK